GNVATGDKVLLVATERPEWRKLLQGAADDGGLKFYAPPNSDVAVKVAREIDPVAIVVDVSAPERAGWLLLDRLKHGFETMHLPVYTVGTMHDRLRALERGASGHWSTASSATVQAALRSPARRDSSLLLVDADATSRDQLSALLSGEGLKLHAAR